MCFVCEFFDDVFDVEVTEHVDCSQFFCHVVDDCVEGKDFVEEVGFCSCCEDVLWFEDPSLVGVVGVVVVVE